MDRVHLCSGSAPLCRTPGALWCTILRDAVTCPACLACLAERDRAPPPALRAEGARVSAAKSLP